MTWRRERHTHTHTHTENVGETEIDIAIKNPTHVSCRSVCSVLHRKDLVWSYQAAADDHHARFTKSAMVGCGRDNGNT